MKYSVIKTYARELRKNQTKAESLFWSNVRNRNFHGFKFTRQFIIEYKKGRYFIADFLCSEHRLIVEIDGKVHLKQLNADQNRENILRGLEYTVIRIKNEEVLDDWFGVEAKLLEQLSPLFEREGRVGLKFI